MAKGRTEETSLRDWIAVFGAILGAFMAVLDIQITNASLPDIQGGIAASLDEGTWISTAYLIAEIITIPLSPWLSDIFSTRRYLIANCVLFLIFSVLCGLSDNLMMMILCRAGQGFTGGVFIPSAMTIVLRCLPLSKRPVGLALFGITATVAPAIGPTIGGWLTDTYSWHWIFYINLVPGAVLIWAIATGLRRERMRLDHLAGGDWPGIFCMAVGLGSLITVLEEGQRKDWFGSPMIRDLAILAAVFIPLFILIELLHQHPFINLRLWKEPAFASASLMGFGMGIGLYGLVYVLPVYFAQIQNYDAMQIGEVVMGQGLPQLLFFPLVPLAMRRFDPRAIVAFGLALFAFSCFLNIHLTHDWAIQQFRWTQLV
ncbi:MAG TPA: DHA2 family efflux MFS transporter permease subunit, partial [Stellaceae bacterium]|nr:DHA2 family efflux MFS transporter permease subunit [Stellaceae bacterium]